MNNLDKMNTNKIHEFDPQIYPRLLWVAYGCSTEELRAVFGDKITEMDDSSDAEVMNCGRKWPNVKGGVLIRFRSKSNMTAGVIAHESTHAALEIFDYVGARIEYNNQEPFAYLVGWIANCCQIAKANMNTNPIGADSLRCANK